MPERDSGSANEANAEQPAMAGSCQDALSSPLNAGAMLAVGVAALAVLPLAPLQAQTSDKPFKPEELDQLLAPIALYPDSLLAQTLMAASYPLEIVEAARWVKANPNLKGDAAVAAVKDKSWDVSVKSLTAFPQVVLQMSEHLEWMQKLGDALIAQEQDVADSIQRLRAKAADSGNLKSGKEQTVTTQGAGADRMYVIEPAQPEVVYVPSYNPNDVYGQWASPAYPPTYFPPPAGYGYGSALVRGLLFGAGIAATSALFGGWNWGRGNSYVNLNVNRAINIDRTFNVGNAQGGRWRHDAIHRKGVAYRDLASRERFGRVHAGADQREAFRGRLANKAGGGQPGAPANARPNLPGGGAHRPGRGGGHPNLPGGSGAGRPHLPAGGGNHPNLPHPGAGGGQHPNIPRPGQGGHGVARNRPATGNRGGAIRGVNHGAQVNRQAARGRAQQTRAQGHAARGGGRRGGRH